MTPDSMMNVIEKYGKVVVYKTATNAYNKHVYHTRVAICGEGVLSFGYGDIFGYGDSSDKAIFDLYNNLKEMVWDTLTAE